MPSRKGDAGSGAGGGGGGDGGDNNGGGAGGDGDGGRGSGGGDDDGGGRFSRFAIAATIAEKYYADTFWLVVGVNGCRPEK